MSESRNPPQTLYDKVLGAHIVHERQDGTILLYVDRHLIHEVSSPQAFRGLKATGRKVRRPEYTLATTDHNVATTSRKAFKNVQTFVTEKSSRLQCVTLEDNVRQFGIPYFGLGDQRQGIVHVIGPEQGFTLPGATVVCSDSHTSTHGAFGALAFGIGTTEAEHVLATETLLTRRSKNMRVQVDGDLSAGVSSKDVILHIIGHIGIAGGTGCVIEYTGSTILGFSMEARMSICNMSIEAGARGGMIAPDDKTFAYLEGRPLAPQGNDWDMALEQWKALYSDPGAKYDTEVWIDALEIVPTVTWGTTAECVVPITGRVPDPQTFATQEKQESGRRMLEYMGLDPGTPMQEITIDNVFIGSCTNSRIEDLRIAAQVVRGRHVASNIKQALVVPGSGVVKKQAEMEGLDQVFLDAGFQWREAGCSMCLGMNDDVLAPGERCASTSNRNFEGRQGARSRTHLVSPAMAAAAAVVGRLADVREFVGSISGPALPPEPRTPGRVTETPVQSNAGYGAHKTAAEDANGDGLGENSAADVSLNLSSGFPKFTVLKGIAAPLDRANIDTDAILPKQFLGGISRTGLAHGCFFDWRLRPDGTETDFVLNQKPYRQSKILVVTGANFGCGSSREHAPWALLDFGIRCIVAPSFADIFFNNAFKNGMLSIAITDRADLRAVASEAKAGRPLEVDLPNQVIRDATGNLICGFQVEEFRKYCLINGLDDIALTMQMEDKICAFEDRRRKAMPWFERCGFSKKEENGAVDAKAVAVPGVIKSADERKLLEW